MALDKAATFWTLCLLCALPVWWWAITDMSIDYDRHDALIEPETGAKLKPSQVMNLTKVINITDDYIENTNAQQRLYDLEHQLNWENPFIMDQSYSNEWELKVSGWPAANKAKCGQDLNWLLNQLNDHRKTYTLIKGKLGYDLTNWMDSFGQPEAGTYSGVINWLGSHRKCSKLTLNEGKIKSRYCIGKMRPIWWPKNETIVPKTRIRLGLCLPESCDTQSFDHYSSMIEQLGKFEFNEFYRENLVMESLFCLPDERSPMRQLPTSGWIFIGLACGWLVILLSGTLFYELLPKFISRDYAVNKYPQISARLSRQFEAIILEVQAVKRQRKNSEAELKIIRNPTISSQILKALSLRCNLKVFKTNSFHVKYNQGQRVRVDLGGLDFFKGGMATLVVLGHSAYISMAYVRSLENRIEMSTSMAGQMVISIARCVDTFFVFFGLLTSYTMLRKFSVRQLSNPLIWIGVNLGVLLRITPLFMLVYWYTKSISPYTGWGPWWDYGVDRLSLRGGCMHDSSWIRAIPYFGSMGSPRVPACNLPSWFIISYSQISITLPILTYIICKLPGNFARCLMVAFLSCVSAANIGYKLLMQDTLTGEGFALYGGFIPDLMEKFQSTGYTSTFGRFGCVSVGCLVGFLLHQYETCKIKEWPAWLRSKVMMGFIIFLHAFIILLPLVGMFFTNYYKVYASLEQVVGVNSLSMIIWPILNAILIIHGTSIANHTVIVRFCSHSFWHVFNRICLAMYLVHWEVIFVGVTSFEEGPSYGFIIDVFRNWAFGLLFSMGIAFILHIGFEAPLSELLMVIARILTPPKDNQSDTSGSEMEADSASANDKNRTFERHPEKLATYV